MAALTREARQAAAAAGQPVGDQAAAELDQTLRTVLPDPHAPAELTAGRLVHSLVPGRTLPAVPAGAAPKPSPRPSSGTRAAAAQTARRAAEKQRQQRLADAERSVRQLGAKLCAAEADLARARAKADSAAERLGADQDRLHTAEQAGDKARVAVTAAEKGAARAGHVAETAELALGRLGRELADQQAALAGLRSAVEPSP